MSVNDALNVLIDLLSNATDQADRLKIATMAAWRCRRLALTFAGGTQALPTIAGACVLTGYQQ
jgi:hypothetical protein